MESEKIKQLPFAFATQNLMGREDFMVTECNRSAFAMIEAWPNWIAKGLIVYGPEGCGKSHLAHLWVDKVRQTLNRADGVTAVDAGQIKMRQVHKLATHYQHLVVENLTVNADNEALFHLFNIFQEEANRSILWTSRVAPSQMHFSLKDLQSRLNMLPCVAIEKPDDQMMQMIIVKLFNDRQLSISPEILTYILNHAQRSFSYIRKLVAEIDAISLAYHTSVNHLTVKKAINIINEQEDKQRDLFDEW